MASYLSSAMDMVTGTSAGMIMTPLTSIQGAGAVTTVETSTLQVVRRQAKPLSNVATICLATKTHQRACDEGLEMRD